MKAGKLIALTSCCVSMSGYALTTSDLSFESGSDNSNYTLQAMGAGYSNGFAVKLPNVDSSNVASVTMSKNGQAVEHTVLQSGSETVLVVSEDLRAELDALGVLTSGCTYYRTQSNCLNQQATDILSYQMVVELTTPVARDQIGYPPYDSFIFAV